MAYASMYLPSDLSQLLHRLRESGRIFTEVYEFKEERMQAITSELGEIYEKAAMPEDTTTYSRVALRGLGVTFGTAAAILLARSPVVGTIVIAGGTAAALVSAYLLKAGPENICTETVEKLGKDFMTITERLKEVLEEIKEDSRELEEKLEEVEESEQLQKLHRQTAELAQTSREVIDVTLAMQLCVRKLLNFISKIIGTPEEEAKLRNGIADAASLCDKTVTEFAKMRNMLKDFRE